MNKVSMGIAVAALAFASLACTITIPFPTTRITTGPTQTEPIHVPAAPDAKTITHVTLQFGAGKLELTGGASSGLVDGTATFNVTDFAPQITTNGTDVRITQRNLEVHNLPNFGTDQVLNEWKLQLGNTPVNLSVNAGAYSGQYDLGGLALTDLHIADGASNVNLGFARPNTAEMASLSYETGASNVTLTGLGNANFDSMSFRAGAGNYTLDFSGSLRRDAHVEVESGLSSVTIRVPQSTPTNVRFEGGLSNIRTSGDWQQNGGVYSRTGTGPTLSIVVSMAAGDVNLEVQ